ncbi:MAG: 3'-5' exonuclease, partial [Candidatus Hadarchaeum sp.]
MGQGHPPKRSLSQTLKISMMSMRGLLLDVDFAEEEEKPSVKLFVKVGSETVVAVDNQFEEYFYVVADNPAKTCKLIEKIEPDEDGRPIKPKSVEIVRRTLLGNEVETIRVSFHQPRDASKLRHKIRELPGVKEIYEFDIPLVRRYLIDRGLTPMSGVEFSGRVETKNGVKTVVMEGVPKLVPVDEPKLNIMSFDIEVYNPTGSVRPDKDPIIMI